MPIPLPIVDGDSFFTGVNMRLDPGQLQPGQCAFAKNKRFVNGKAATRPGIKKMPWTNKAADAWTEKTYTAGEIVTYSGRAAIVSAATEAAITSGSGTIALSSTNAIVSNGDFASGTSWSTTAETNSNGVAIGGLGGSSQWTIGSGKATHAASSGADNLYQDIHGVLGCDYTISITVSGYSAGSIKVGIGTTATAGASTITANGTHSVATTSEGNAPQRLYIQASADFVGSVDDVSIAEGATPEKVALIGTTQIAGTSTPSDTSDDFYHQGGPASNNFLQQGTTNTTGPFFQRDSSTDPGTEPPIATIDFSANTNTLTSGWNNLGHRTYGYGSVYGTGIFRDPTGIEHLLVASGSGVFSTKESNPSRLLEPWDTQAGAAITSDVEFVQCFNVVVMLRGENLEPLIMERIDEGFKSISQTSSDTTIDENDSDGTESMPNATTGLFFQNRLLVPHSRDLIAASDFLNYTRYQPVLSNFRINQGSEDDLVSLVRINNSTIACFKTNSIYIVSNIYGNLADITLDEVTREYGAVGKNSIVQVGSDVVFLSSKRGVTSLGIADNGKVSAIDVPLSDPIQPLIDRINWNYASGAAAAYHNNRLYMAVPLDGATENNAILVYDYLAGGWAGYDSGNAVKVKRFVETELQGKRRLFFLSTDGFINLYDDDLEMCGFVDEVPSSTVSTNAAFGQITVEQISDEVKTRGYTAGDISQKNWKGAEIQLQTNDPSFQVKAVFDGPEEDDTTLTLDTNGNPGSKTFSRTKYDRPFDKADFAESMVNDDFFTKYRQDYSVNPTTEIDLPDGVADGDNIGFDPDLHQHTNNKYRYRGQGRYVQFQITNTNGRAEVGGVKAEAAAGQNLTTTEI